MARDNGGQISLPEMHAPYLFEWLRQAGPAMPSGMGMVPLSAAELGAWSAGQAVHLDHWEFQTLQAASRAYCAEQARPGDFPPYGDPDDLYDDDVIAERLARGLDALCR